MSSGWAPISASITARTISSPRTLRATEGRGADVILDMVGGDYVERNYAAAALDGRIVQIAFLKGQKTTVDLRPIMAKRLVHTGSTLRPRSPAEKAVIAEALRAKVWPLLEAGRCRPVIDSVFPAFGGREGARADRERRACRQDRVDDVNARRTASLKCAAGGRIFWMVRARIDPARRGMRR